MAQCMGVYWQCDSCNHVDSIKPWECPSCGKEVCEHCFDRYGLCSECSQGKTDDEARILSNWVEE